MAAKIIYFPVGNGDMTLIQTENDINILIDCNIRNPEENPDVMEMLKEYLKQDDKGRYFVDLFVWSHPDEDHCKGIKDNFYLGKPEDYSVTSDKVFINEIWSSPMVYRRASNNHTLCDDAKALNKEVKRRVNVYKNTYLRGNEGDYVLILGEDENGKTDDIDNIVVKLDYATSNINDKPQSYIESRLLGPSPKCDLDEDEEKLGKNHSSVIMNYKLLAGNSYMNFLSAGDAEVVCLEALNSRMTGNYTGHHLDYDVLQVPHHCSWHALSHDSLKEKGDSAEVSAEALDCLSHANSGAFIVASCRKIENDANNPPAHKAKKEYQKIVQSKDVQGDFKCVADFKDKPLVLILEDGKITIESTVNLGKSNDSGAVNRKGSDGYS
jgi:hypothetical protein